MCQIGLTFEYSRMKVTSLSRGCEIAQVFVRYMDRDTLDTREAQQTLRETFGLPNGETFNAPGSGYSLEGKNVALSGPG